MSSGIVRIEHDRDRPYVIISKALTEDRRLSFALRGVLTYLLGKRHDWTTYMTEVEASGAEGREAIKAIFAEGRRYGYIRTIEHRTKGKVSYEHIIYEKPLDTPIPDILTPDGQPSSILKRQQNTGHKKGKKSVQEGKKKADKKPSTGSRQRQTVNGQPSTETRSLVSNEVAIIEEEEKKETGGQSGNAARFSSPSGEEPKTKTPSESGSDQAAPTVEQQAPTPGSFQDGNVEGGHGHSSATEVQQIPPTAAPAADSVDARLDELLNRRWLSDYTVRGERKRALIDEPTKSGIRRRDVARDITLDTLEDLIRSARSERRQLEARAKLDPSVTVPAIATLILRTVEQRMQDIEAVREAARAHQKATEAPAAPAPTPEAAAAREDAPSTPERDRLSVGSQWRRRTDGQLLTVKNASAREIQFEDGTRVTGFKVRVDFEHVGWVD